MNLEIKTEKVIKAVEVDETRYFLELTREEFAVLIAAVGSMSGSIAAEKVSYQDVGIKVTDLEACKFLGALYDQGYEELGYNG